MLANTQWRMNGIMPVGMDFPAVIQIAEINLIEVTPALFQKMKLLEESSLNKWQKEELRHG
jgi:hypothetical protein